MNDIVRKRPRGRFRTNDPAGTRGCVLDAAAKAFQLHGYRGTSLHDVVTAAGVTPGALHHHFASKSDLALAVIAERVGEEVGQTWVAAVESAPTASEGILGVFERVADILEGQGSVSGCPLGNLSLELSLSDESLRMAIEDEYRSWRTAIAACLARDAAIGNAPWSVGDADDLADTVVAMFTGAMSIAKAEQSARALRSCGGMLRRLLGCTCA